MDGIQVETAADVRMAEGSGPAVSEPAAAAPARPAAQPAASTTTPAGASRSHLKRSLPVDYDEPSAASGAGTPDGSSPASAAGTARASKKRGLRVGPPSANRKPGPAAVDDAGAYSSPGGRAAAGKRPAAALAPFDESSSSSTAAAAAGAPLERAAKSEGRNRSLALSLAAVEGTPTDPKGKGKAVVHGGDNKVVPNEDFCQVCQGKGRFICCDGCPHSFHLTCLDPPMDDDSVPDKDSLWFCRDCHMAQGHIPTPPPQQTIFGPLLSQLEETSPAQFQLPNEVKAYFKGVAVAPNGAYVDGDRIRPMKADRRGFAEERDLHRLKDAKGFDVLCYKCGGSAAPVEGAAELRPARLSGRVGVEVSRWRSIVSCDYCNLHWHFDCLDPPMTAVPQVTHKWMCPNHAEHVMPKTRIPKQGALLVDVAGPGEFNNGHVEILPAPEAAERVRYEDVVLSSKRYRVPETTIIVDFWSKVLGRPRAVKKVGGGGGRPALLAPARARSGSPLTSLDSDDGGSDAESAASSSDLSSLRSDAGESTANGSSLAVPAQFPVSFSQLVDATILSPALESNALPAAGRPEPSPSKKIILRFSRSNGSGSPPKPDETPAVAPETNGTAAAAEAAAEPKPFGDEGVPAMVVVDAPAENGHAGAGFEATLEVDLASADEEVQMRAIRELIKAKGKDKLLQFLQQS